MCVSIGPTVFAKTIHGTYESGDGRHVTYYQNTVGAPASSAHAGKTASGPSRGRPGWNRDNWDFGDAPRGNALIIPLLGDFKTIKPVYLSRAKQVLKDIQEALTPKTRSLGGPMSFGVPFASKGVMTIEYDVYTIKVAERASLIPGAVEEVSPEKRPPLNQSLFDAFQKWYDAPIAVACFDPRKAGEAAPVAFSYIPFDSEVLFLYTLDGHDGSLPDFNAKVAVDHTLFAGSYHNEVDRRGPGEPVHYSDEISPELARQLPKKVCGAIVNRSMINGDVVLRASDVRKGIFKGLRALPPGAQTDPSRPKEFITSDF